MRCGVEVFACFYCDCNEFLSGFFHLFMNNPVIKSGKFNELGNCQSITNRDHASTCGYQLVTIWYIPGDSDYE